MKLGLHFSCSALGGETWADLYGAAIEQAQLAEELGFESAVVSEHHFKKEGWIPSPFVLCGAIAARTSRIRVGTDIVILPFQHPIRIAEEILTLDNLSRGRAVLGVGMGDSEAEFTVFQTLYRQRVSRSEEAMKVIRRLMNEERVTHDGTYFRFDDVTVSPRPLQRPGPPIWYGAISEAGARRAARLADALIMGPTLDLDRLRAMRGAYDEELQARGHDASSGQVILRREAYVAEDGSTAWRQALAALKYQYSEIYTNFPSGGSDEEFRTYAKERFLVGDPREVLALAEQLRDELRVDLLLLRLQLPGLADHHVIEATRLLGNEVLPRLAANEAGHASHDESAS